MLLKFMDIQQDAIQLEEKNLSSYQHFNCCLIYLPQICSKVTYI